MKRLFSAAFLAFLIAVAAASVSAGDSGLSVEQMKQMSRQAELLWATGNTVPASDVLAESYINHQPGGGKAAEPLGLAAYLAFMEEFHKSFSPQEVKVVQVVVEGDMAAARFESTAVHSGAFMGLEPTGKEITWTGVQVDRFENGKIVESWVNWDEYGFYKQLGLIQ